MKRTIFSLFILVVCAAVFFWNALASSMLDSMITYYSSGVAGMNWDAELVEVGQGKIRIVKPQLQGKRDDFAFHAQSVDISYIIDPIRLTVELVAKIEAPMMAVVADADLTFLGRMIEGESGWITYRTKIDINDGIIALQDHGKVEPEIVHYDFHYDNFRDVHGDLRLQFDDGRAVALSFDRNERMTLGAQMEFKQVDGLLVSQLAGIFSAKARAWQITKGTVDGTLAFQRMRGKRPFAIGDLVFKEIELHNVEEGITGTMPLVRVGFAADKNLKTTTVGNIDFVEPAAFSFAHEGVPYFEIPHMKGSLHLEGHDGTRVEMEGICGDRENIFKWRLGGSVRFFDEVQAFADLALALDDGVGEEAMVHCLYKKINGKWDGADVELKNVGVREFRFVQQTIARHFDGWDIVNLHDGVVDANGHLFLSEEGIQQLKIEHVAARNVSLEYHPWNLYLGVGNLDGTISVNLQSHDPFRTLNTDLFVEGGVIRLNRPEENFWQLTNLQTKIAVINGVFQQSVMEGAFAGMRGTATLDWVDNALAMNLHFAGTAHGFLPILPTQLKHGFHREFLDDRLTLAGDITRKSGGFHVEGSVLVEDQYLRSEEKIDFGFDLERVVPPNTSLLTNIGMAMGGGYIVKNGTFDAKKIPLAKYIAPFAFVAEDGTQEVEIVGDADFVGKFDQHTLAMEYNGDNIVIEGEDFVLNTGVEDPQQPARPLAQYHLDFDTMHHYGTLPVRLGSYLDKGRNLLFNDLKTDMRVEDERIHAAAVECFCLGAFFTGDIDVDLSLPGKGVLDVDVVIQSMQAKVSQMRGILNHFEDPPAFAQLPLEGNLIQRGDGGKIVFNVRPQGTETYTRFKAQLYDGELNFFPFDVSIRELFFNIDFDDDANRMDIEDLQGIVLIGKPDNVEEYGLSAEKCYFTDYAHNIGVFDLWIGDRARDILRFVGTTKGIDNEGDDAYIRLAFDPSLTHFGNVHPEESDLVLKNWNEVAQLKLGFDLHLQTLLHDLKVLSHSGIFFLSDHIQKQVDALRSAKGDFHFAFDYDEGTSVFRYDAVGTDIAAGEVTYQECRLNGKIKDDSWIVDQFKLDDMSLAAEVVKAEKQWKINFLGLQYGKSLLLGMDGVYFEGNTFLEGKINLLQVDLSKLHEWPSLREIAVAYHPRGELRGNGTVRLETSLNEKGWRADVSLSTSVKNWGVAQAQFVDAENFSFHYLSDRGITIRSLSTGVYVPRSDSLMNTLRMERLDHTFALDDWELENLRFSIPTEHLATTGILLQQLHGEADGAELGRFLGMIQHEGDIRGGVSGYYSSDESSIEVALDDGEYVIDGVPHEFKETLIAYDPVYLSMKGKYRLEDYWPQFSFITSSTSFERGYITLSDTEESDPLSIHWKLIPNTGFVIEDAVGTLCGTKVNLVRDPKEMVDDEWHHLHGSIQCELPDSLPLFSKEIGNKIREQGIAGNYEMEGKWAFTRNEKKSGGSCFAGNIAGVNCQAKGYHFKSLKGEVSYSPEKAAIHNVLIEDDAGIVDIGVIDLVKDDKEEWSFTIPKFVVKDFRPSLLREVGDETPLQRSALILSLIEAEGIHGLLSQNATWKGIGHFTFANPPKSSLQNTIFAIPAEIITRIGLNPAVLTPIQGAVHFEIEEGKIVFKKFKDVYSDSHASKFYLPESNTPSFLDFDGNLNIQIRMKQYNLLFKIAELFTVTVKGNLEKPIYTLRKQERRGKESKEGVD